MHVAATSQVPTATLLTAPMDALAATRGNEAVAREQLAVDFESVFVSMLIKEMRQSLNGEGLFHGDTSDSYGGLFDIYLGQHLAQAGGLGIGQLITQLLDTDVSS